QSPVHGMGPRHLGHGVRRQDQERRPAIGRRDATAGQDDQGAGRERPQSLISPPPSTVISLQLFIKEPPMDKENTLYIHLKDGRVVIEMRPDLAAKHVAQIKKLAREGKYDGVVFHRVIEGFMAQTGDPTGTGSGGMGETLAAEFNKEPHTRGAVSMARTSAPNSTPSQFFVVFKDSNFLDG